MSKLETASPSSPTQIDKKPESKVYHAPIISDFPKFRYLALMDYIDGDDEESGLSVKANNQSTKPSPNNQANPPNNQPTSAPTTQPTNQPNVVIPHSVTGFNTISGLPPQRENELAYSLLVYLHQEENGGPFQPGSVYVFYDNDGTKYEFRPVFIRNNEVIFHHFPTSKSGKIYQGSIARKILENPTRIRKHHFIG